MDLHFTGKITGTGSITKEDYVELVNNIVCHLGETGWAKKTGNVLTILIKGFEERVLLARVGGPAPISLNEPFTVHLLALETKGDSARRTLVKKQGDWVTLFSGEEIPIKNANEVLSEPLTEVEILDYARRGYASRDGMWEETKTPERS